MKKVRFMLTAIVVLAVVGGALAFKANKSLEKVCFYQKAVQTDQPGTCPVVSLKVDQQTLTSTTLPFGRVLITEAESTITTEACPATTNCNAQITIADE